MLFAAHAQQCEGQSFNISFSEFPSGTTITNQYADKGVVFGPGAFITSDSANPTTPVLSGTPRFHGPITATFVSPPDGSANADTTALTFNAGYFDEVGSTSVSYLDINGASLGSATNQGLGIVTFTAPAGTHSFTIGGTSDSAGFAIDNLNYTLGESALKILAPTVDQTFALSEDNRTRSPDISFRAGGSAASGQVSWQVTMEYDTDRPRGLPGLESSFQSQGTGEKLLFYSSRGGRARVTASTGGGNSATTTACPLEYFYVVGTAIPDSDVTARLVSLYNGTTPNLLTGIADKESTYRQFSSRTKYDKQALWPLESAQDGGSHIGLMQVSSAGAQGVANAWDWLENTNSAATLFREKLRIAASLERRIRHNHHGLRALTDVERENMALTLYGPSAMAGQENQYYRAVQLPSGGFDWVVNTANNPGGVAYADDVRSRIR